MDTLEIKNYLETNTVTSDAFLNVYALDQLPKKKLTQERWLLICNCCPADRRGEHWVAMFYERGGDVEFFDSFGLTPEAYGDAILSFISAQEQDCVVYNNAQLQSPESDACGHYCIMFAYHRCRGESFKAIVEKLNALTRDNVVKFIVTTLLF